MIYGALNKKELSKIKKDIDSLTVVHVNELISQKFIDLMLVYSKSHGLAIPDAIIAATSLVCNINLFTLNAKDFTFIKGITLHNM